MDNEKIVVVLLIITIVLSVFSIIMAFGGGGDSFRVPQRTAVDNPDSSGNIVFGLEQAPSSGGTG